MHILKFLKSVLPNFGKDRLTEDARITHDELKNVVAPSYAAATPLTTTASFSSSTLNEMNALFKRNFKMEKSKNFLDAVGVSLKKAIEFEETLQDLIEKKFEKDIVVEGITIYKANLIQAQEMLSFVSRYAAKLLNFAYVCEMEALGEDSTGTTDALSKGEQQYIRDSFLDFVKALAVVARPEKETIKLLESVPDVVVGANPDAILSVYGDTKTDPLFMRDVKGFSASPIFHLRMMVAEWQTIRYKEVQDLKRVLELRLLSMQKQQDKHPDARLDKEINYTQSRVDTYAEKLRKFEESVQ